jgi:hypothetical protein
MAEAIRAMNRPTARGAGRTWRSASVSGMRGDDLQEQRSAPPPIGQQPPPEVSTVPRPADGPPGAAGRRKVQERDSVRGLKADIEDVIGPEVPVHDPRLTGGELALDDGPLVMRRSAVSPATGRVAACSTTPVGQGGNPVRGHRDALGPAGVAVGSQHPSGRPDSQTHYARPLPRIAGRMSSPWNLGSDLPVPSRRFLDVRV